MDKAITTALLVIAGVICIMFVFNSVYPAVNRSSQAMVSMSDTLNDRMKSRINIVHASNSENRTTVYVWIKNVGSTRIVDVESSDLFFGQETDFARIPFTDDAPASYPQWDYEIENSELWDKSATLKITITYSTDPGAGTYFIKMIIPNGIADEFYFSM